MYGTAIFRMRADGSGVRRVTRPKLSDHGTCHDSPAVSPDGRIVAYADFGDCDHGFDVDLDTVDPNGHRARLDWADDVYGGFDPAWAPRGRTLAFAGDDPFGIWIVSDGSKARRVYRGPAYDPAWSPDGRWLVFAAERGEDIWLVRADGTGARPLLRTKTAEWDPAWLPRPR